MGQAKSSPAAPAIPSHKKRAGNFAAFRRHVGEASRILERFLDSRGRMLVLSLHPAREADISIPVLWKRVVVVRVDMVHQNGVRQTGQRLNYKQFYKLFCLLKQYECIEEDEHTTPAGRVIRERSRSKEGRAAGTKLEQREESDGDEGDGSPTLLQAAAALEKEFEERRSDSEILLSSMELIQQAFSATESEASTSEDPFDAECVICFEREADTVLPCAHKFCHVCVDEWSTQCDTCPMCRSVASKDDSWLLIEAGDSTQEISTFLQDFVEQLANA